MKQFAQGILAFSLFIGLGFLILPIMLLGEYFENRKK